MAGTCGSPRSSASIVSWCSPLPYSPVCSAMRSMVDHEATSASGRVVDASPLPNARPVERPRAIIRRLGERRRSVEEEHDVATRCRRHRSTGLARLRGRRRDRCRRRHACDQRGRRAARSPSTTRQSHVGVTQRSGQLNPSPMSEATGYGGFAHRNPGEPPELARPARGAPRSQVARPMGQLTPVPPTPQ